MNIAQVESVMLIVDKALKKASSMNITSKELEKLLDATKPVHTVLSDVLKAILNKLKPNE